MVIFSVQSAIDYINENVKSIKNEKTARLRAEVIMSTRTTPNNLFISICDKKKGTLFYWLSRGRERYNFLKFNNFFSLKKMFAEALAYTIRFKQTVFRLVGKGRSRIKPFSREFKKWGIRVFYVINRIRRPFNGCKFPHTRRI